MVNKTSKIATWKRIILHDMLPVSKSNFFDSEWHEWLGRINDGLKSKKQRRHNIPEDAPRDVAELLDEECLQAEDVSNNMYAALIVSLWAKIEHFLRKLCRYSTCFGLSPIDRNVNFVKFVMAHFKNNLGIDIVSIENYDYANLLRILNNAFKHNNGFYHPDRNPISEKLAKRFKISENSPIKYIDLPIEELILKAGSFCATLYKETEKALNRKTTTKDN
ncbi:MAG: hypothetical protein WC374_03730 [Phycisphaerae bacterium]|jgi:hypothetical protein